MVATQHNNSMVAAQNMGQTLLGTGNSTKSNKVETTIHHAKQPQLSVRVSMIESLNEEMEINKQSKEQRETTVHHYFKTWSVNAENVKNFESFFKCCCKTIKSYDETSSHEDRHRKGRPRVTFVAEDTFINS